MKNIILFAAAVAIGWFFYNKQDISFLQHNPSTDSVMQKCITRDGRVIYGKVPEGIVCDRIESVKNTLTVLPSQTPANSSTEPFSPSGKSSREPNKVANFKCDGRTRCSQMASCEEATYFLSHCPGVEGRGWRRHSLREAMVRLNESS